MEQLTAPASGSLAIVAYNLVTGKSFSDSLINGLIYFGIDTATEMAISEGKEYLEQPAITAMLYGQVQMYRSYGDFPVRYALKYFSDDVVVAYMATILGNLLKKHGRLLLRSES